MAAKLTVDIMYRALVNRDTTYEGIFFAGIKTTGIFCRPSCRARKPKRENVEFFRTAGEAIQNGYRPCAICRPLEYKDEAPSWLRPLIDEIERRPGKKIRDRELKEMGLDQARVRRWFKRNHNMTFQAYQRLLRLEDAFGRIKRGGKIIDSAFESGYDSLSGFTESFKKAFGSAPKYSKEKTLVRVTRISTLSGPCWRARQTTASGGRSSS